MDGFFEVSVLRLKMLWRQIHAFRPHYSRQQLHAASPDTRKVLLLIVLCRTTMSCASPARHQSATAGQRLASDARRLGLYCQGTYPLSRLSDTTIHKIRRRSLTGLCDQGMGENDETRCVRLNDCGRVAQLLEQCPFK